MRFSSLSSIMSHLKLVSGNPAIDQLMPEMARMVGIVERNLGLSKKALGPPKIAYNVEVSRTQGQLPADFFEEQEILDCYFPPPVSDCCTCNIIPCCCGYQLYNYREAEFRFLDCTIECPFPTGSVSFSYWALPTDPTDGLPMVLEGHVEAFTQYFTSILKQGEMNAGLIPIQLFEVNNRQWEKQSLFTRSRDNVPSKRSVRIADEITTHPYKFRLR